MNRFELIPFTSDDALAKAVAIVWLDEIATANRANRTHSVALSGGRITLKFFASVIESARKRDVSFANVHFFWADERCVPPNDPESSFAAADKHFFPPLGIAPDKIHRILGEETPEKAAELATADMRRIVPTTLSSPSPPPREERAGVRRQTASDQIPSPQPSPRLSGERETGAQPVLDIVFLGMGEDGHVASLFPGESESALADTTIYRVIRNSPKPPPNRVTLGYPAIAAARSVWVLASGTGKEAALQESLRPDGKTPLARVIRLREQTKIFSDIRLT